MNDDQLDVDDKAELQEALAHLRQTHQDLDAAIAALETTPNPDQLRTARLKKQKLILRDQIAKLENRLTPDLIA